MIQTCLCCAKPFEARNGVTVAPRMHFCPRCAGEEKPACNVYDGGAVARAIAHQDPRQKDMFW